LWKPTAPTTLFGNLKLVKINYYPKEVAEFILPLVELILATSPVLLSLRITGVVNAACLEKLIRFKRASKEAEIWVV
jgi:hypothetical protein